MPRDEDEYRKRIAMQAENFATDRQNVMKSIDANAEAERKSLENRSVMQFGSATPVAGQPGMFQGATDRANLAQERIAALQYGVGGSADRGVAAEDRRTNAMAPAYAGEGALSGARALDQVQETDYNKIFNDKMVSNINKPTEAMATSRADKFKTSAIKYREDAANLSSFGGISDSIDKDTPLWKPTGNKFFDKMLRVDKNILAYPGRKLGRGLGALSTANFWNE